MDGFTAIGVHSENEELMYHVEPKMITMMKISAMLMIFDDGKYEVLDDEEYWEGVSYHRNNKRT